MLQSTWLWGASLLPSNNKTTICTSVVRLAARNQSFGRAVRSHTPQEVHPESMAVCKPKGWRLAKVVLMHACSRLQQGGCLSCPVFCHPNSAQPRQSRAASCTARITSTPCAGEVASLWGPSVRPVVMTSWTGLREGRWGLRARICAFVQRIVSPRWKPVFLRCAEGAPGLSSVPRLFQLEPGISRFGRGAVYDLVGLVCGPNFALSWVQR